MSDSRSNITDGPVAGHRLLADPSVFNISLLLPPSLGFLQRLKDLVPPDSDIAISTLTSFLDDFLVNVFQPQLEETVAELCTQTFLDLDAFQRDANWGQKSSRPLFKVSFPMAAKAPELLLLQGTSTFFALIQAFCRLLQTIPQDPAFTQLLVSQISAYYTRCLAWYKGT